jgi:hypothetical protein
VLLRVSVDHDIEIIVTLGHASETEGETVGVVCEIGVGAHAVPPDVVAPEAAPRQRGMCIAKRNGQLEEPEHLAIRLVCWHRNAITTAGGLHRPPIRSWTAGTGD